MELINWDKKLLVYEQAVDELIVKFKGIQREFKKTNKHSPIESIDGRVKSVASILDKANRKNISEEEVFEKLYDIAGIRIICRFVEDIYKVIDIIKNRAGIDMEIIEEEDYVTNKKKSGYRSYHFTIKYPVITSDKKEEIYCEIQIRTMAMNFWATIEHSLNYKYNGNMPDDLKERLKTCADAASILDSEMGKIRGEILEAQQIVQTKNILVNEVMKNMQNLYYVANVEKMNEFNKEFIELYQEGNLDKLNNFNKQLEVMAKLYKVEYI